MTKGWRKESRRHALASKGIKTKKKNPNMARYGSQNGRWKGGHSKTYYRRIAGCEPNDGKIVHHKDHNKWNSDPENLEIIEPDEDTDAWGVHSKEHPEKGYRDRQRAFPRWVQRLRNEKGRDWRKWRFSTYHGDDRLTYSEMQKVLLTERPKVIKSYYNGNYYRKIKFRENN